MLGVWGHIHKKDVLSTEEAPQVHISRFFGKMAPQCFFTFNSQLVIYLFFILQDLGELKEKKNNKNTVKASRTSKIPESLPGMPLDQCNDLITSGTVFHNLVWKFQDPHDGCPTAFDTSTPA